MKTIQKYSKELRETTGGRKEWKKCVRDIRGTFRFPGGSSFTDKVVRDRSNTSHQYKILATLEYSGNQGYLKPVIDSKGYKYECNNGTQGTLTKSKKDVCQHAESRC